METRDISCIIKEFQGLKLLRLASILKGTCEVSATLVKHSLHRLNLSQLYDPMHSFLDSVGAYPFLGAHTVGLVRILLDCDFSGKLV